MEQSEVKSILIIVTLNIILPTLDTFTDIKLVSKLFIGTQSCEFDPSQEWSYERNICRENPVDYCSNAENNQNFCHFAYHPKMALAMLTPFLLNYIVCFIAFYTKEKNKEKKDKLAFIFALLNLYPQFGKNQHKVKLLKYLFKYFRGRKDHPNPGCESIRG